MPTTLRERRHRNSASFTHDAPLREAHVFVKFSGLPTGKPPGGTGSLKGKNLRTDLIAKGGTQRRTALTGNCSPMKGRREAGQKNEKLFNFWY